jgi:hypothetical protein
MTRNFVSLYHWNFQGTGMVEKSHTAGWFPELYEPFRNFGRKVAEWFAPRSEASAFSDDYEISVASYVTVSGRGALCQILRNRLYRGEIEHKGQIYQGNHRAIVAPVGGKAPATTSRSILALHRFGRVILCLGWAKISSHFSIKFDRAKGGSACCLWPARANQCTKLHEARCQQGSSQVTFPRFLSTFRSCQHRDMQLRMSARGQYFRLHPIFIGPNTTYVKCPLCDRGTTKNIPNICLPFQIN